MELLFITMDKRPKKGEVPLQRSPENPPDGWAPAKDVYLWSHKVKDPQGAEAQHFSLLCQDWGLGNSTNMWMQYLLHILFTVPFIKLG